MVWLQDTLADMIGFYACDDSRLQLITSKDPRIMHKDLTSAIARNDVAYELGLRSYDKILGVCVPGTTPCYSLDTTESIAAAYAALSSYATSGGQLDIIFKRGSRTYTMELTLEDCPAATGTPYGRCDAVP